MHKSFLKSLKRKHCSFTTLPICQFEQEFEKTCSQMDEEEEEEDVVIEEYDDDRKLIQEQYTFSTLFSKKRSRTSRQQQQQQESLMSSLNDELIMLICSYVDSWEDVNLCLKVLNRHWYCVIKQNELMETEEILFYHPRDKLSVTPTSTSEGSDVCVLDISVAQEDSLYKTKNSKNGYYRCVENRSFLRRYSKRLSNSTVPHDDPIVIDLTQEEEEEEENLNATTRNGMEGDQKTNLTLIFSPSLSDNDEEEKVNGSLVVVDEEEENEQEDTHVVIDELNLMAPIYEETPQPPLSPSPLRIKEQVTPEYVRLLRSSIITLRFDSFFIELTEPFWSLKKTIERDSKNDGGNIVYELDPSNPIFSVSNFLKIIRYYRNNKWKLTCSRVYSLIDLFHLLKPRTSVFFSSEREVEYFVAEVKNLVLPCSDHVLKVGNLTFLLIQYIQEYKHWFEDDSKKIPDFLKLNNGFECRDSHAKMKRLIKCQNLQKEYTLDLEADHFQVHDHILCYPHSDVINSCIDTLSVTSFPYNDGIYHGDVNNETGLPDGFGSWVVSDDDNSSSERFDGYWVNGFKCGEGKYTSNWFMYNGEWMNDEFNGEGELLFTSGRDCGSLYQGEFSKGKKHGFGIQYYRRRSSDDNHTEQLDHSSMIREENGKWYHAWYRGEWNNDQRCGWGEYRTKTSWKSGQWKRDELLDGIGIVTDENDSLKYSITITNFRITSRKCMVPQNFLNSLQECEDLLESLEGEESQQEQQAIDDYEANNNGPSNPLYAPKRALWNGFCFRSRLEARWAIFLEYLQIDYLYEPKTFRLPNGHKYTPDFYLPSRRVWFEIKPTYPTELERERAQLLSSMPSVKGHRILLIYGSVQPPFVKKFYEGAKAIEFFPNGEQMEPMAWTQCETCKAFDLGLRCRPPCHPEANKGSVTPSLRLQMAFEYVSKVDFDELSKTQYDAMIAGVNNYSSVVNLTFKNNNNNNTESSRRRSKYWAQSASS